MSKHFPNSPAKWDLYFAWPDPLELGRMLRTTTPKGRPIRFVVKEDYTGRKEQWDKERYLYREDCTIATGSDDKGYNKIERVGREDIPPECIYLYGGEYI